MYFRLSKMPPKKKTATKGKELVLPAQEEKEAIKDATYWTHKP